MISENYVELDRRFRDLTTEELESPESLASLNDRDILRADGWSELLRHPRVVLLAEAGSGKSQEMRRQAQRLRDEGECGFYLDLASLDESIPADLMDPAEEAAFLAWKADETSTAWFFLDAVDELKLRRGKLERALNRLSKATNGLLHRMHVVISSRPSDWRPKLDMATFQAKLPIVALERSTVPAPDDVFLEVFRDKGARQHPEPEPKTEAAEPRTVILLPLSEKQIEIFAQRHGIRDAAAFLAEIRKQNAWTFARRPLDLSELAQTWLTLGNLGKRIEQHETNIRAKLKDDSERPDQGVLSDKRAREGAERLALAMTLTRARTIHSPEHRPETERAEGALDGSAILPDWSPAERLTLLRRAVFDPATYGRVRFHHRSVQEYLAACRLRHLREHGMPVRKLLRLLFAELYGVRLVKPSMRPIAAWAALWSEDVRRELTDREPETLLTYGDPGSLPLDARGSLLRAFANAYGDGGWRGLDVPLGEVRRLAHPELAGIVRELWEHGKPNPDVQDLLLDVIWQGAIKGCADIAEAAARDPALSWYQRVAAIRALLACGLTQAVRGVADALMSGPEKWPRRFVHTVAADLFPGILTVPELITLVERTREPRDVVGGFSWAMRGIAEDIEPWSETGVELRNALADLIRRGRDPRQHWHDLKGRSDHVAPALALLCDRQLSSAPGTRDAMLCRAAVIANRFGHGQTGHRELMSDLGRRFEADIGLREVAFWSEVALMDELAPTEDGFNRYFYAQHRGLIGIWCEADRPWLEKALQKSNDPRHRVVALHALINFWCSRGRVAAELDALRDAIKDNSELMEVLQRRTSPVPDPDAEKRERDMRRRERIYEGRERQRIAKWAKWREELIADPEAAFSSSNLFSTASNLHGWLARKRSDNRRNVWDYEALCQAFGEDIARRAEVALKELWRANPPTLWSERQPGERDRTLWLWTYGLCGLAAEAVSPGWPTHLTRDEARTAAVYATVEINGFPAWLADLAASHPDEVREVIGGELAAELALGTESPFLSTLQHLTRTDHDLKRLFVPQLLTAVYSGAWTAPGEPERSHWVQHLTAVLQVLDDANASEKNDLAAECERRFLADPAGPVGPVWLRQSLRLNSSRAAEILASGLDSLPEHDRPARAVSLLAGLFGSRESILLEFADDADRARVLDRLVRCAYHYVRPEDDRQHEGSFTPNTRDDAETARSFLLSALLDTPGPEAHRALLALADDPMFAHFPDRLRLLARHRAASDAEGEPLGPSAVAALNELYEAPPNDRNSLFEVMADRLDDLQQELSHDDFTNRRTLRLITDEAEIQRYLAGRLRDTARGAYIVTREEEVADRKEPDIRLITNNGSHKAAIEVKIARSWSLTDLERALRNQLVGQYLRDESCKAGCLLLTYEGNKTFWEDQKTGARLNFQEVTSYLAAVGSELERQQTGAFRIAVRGIDLRDPSLPMAHRSAKPNTKGRAIRKQGDKPAKISAGSLETTR